MVQDGAKIAAVNRLAARRADVEMAEVVLRLRTLQASHKVSDILSHRLRPFWV